MRTDLRVRVRSPFRAARRACSGESLCSRPASSATSRYEASSSSRMCSRRYRTPSRSKANRRSHFLIQPPSGEAQDRWPRQTPPSAKGKRTISFAQRKLAFKSGRGVRFLSTGTGAGKFRRVFAAFTLRNSFQYSIHHEGPELITRSRNHVLVAVEHIRLWRIGDVANARVPQRLASCCIVSHQASRSIAAED